MASTTPLLETRTASAGQVIDEKRIALMPLSDGNPFVLARLATGIAYTGDLKFSRPFDNGGTSAVTADGASGGNEFTLDGSPNMANGRRVAFVPPAGAVQEFKVETATFDAQQGHTAGATVNVTIKSGTNLLRGDGLLPLSRREALRERLLPRARRPTEGSARLQAVRLQRRRPGVARQLYNGRDRTFFFSAVEWLYDKFPEPGQHTVPTEAKRNGDFSALLVPGHRHLRSADRRAPRRRPHRAPAVRRQHHSGRAASARSRGSILKYYPLPNQAGDAQGLQQLLHQQPARRRLLLDQLPRRPRAQRLRSASSSATRATIASRIAATGRARSTASGRSATILYRINDAVNVDHVWTMSPSSLLNVRGGWSRFQEPSIRQHQGIFDPGQPRIPSQHDAILRRQPVLPSLRVRRRQRSPISATRFSGGTNFSIYSFQPTWTNITRQPHASHRL